MDRLGAGGNTFSMRMLTWVVLVAASGCATNLSTMQTAKTLRPGQFRLAGGGGVYVPAGQAVTAIGTGVAIAKDGFHVNEERKDQLVTSAIALVAMPPTTAWEVSGRYGVVQNLDVGLRWSMNTLRADAKYRLIHLGDREEEGAGHGRSFDVAVGLAGSKVFFANPVMGFLEKVKLADFSRWDVEVPVYVSADVNPYFGVYVAPKWVYSHTDFGLLFDESELLPGAVDTHFLGSTVGVRAGVPKLSVYLEVTGGKTFAKPTVLGRPRDLGGVTLYPAIGLAGSFR